MPRQTEPSVNNALGNLLQGMLSRSEVRSEYSRTITGHPGLRLDILIEDPGRAPVVIEAEYLPAVNVEEEAKSRLGLEVAASARTIEAAIALRYPAAVGDADDLRAALRQARLSYCVFTEESKGNYPSVYQNTIDSLDVLLPFWYNTLINKTAQKGTRWAREHLARHTARALASRQLSSCSTMKKRLMSGS